MPLLGTHGTSVTRASAILQSRAFKASEHGHAGRGAYFWAYETDESYGYQLAESWWAFAKIKKNIYAGDADQGCAVLQVEISQPSERKILDATNILFREALFKAMRDKDCTSDDVPDVTTVLIEEMEAANGDVFDLVKIQIATPPLVKGRDHLFAQMISKSADAYLVRDTGLGMIENIRKMG